MTTGIHTKATWTFRNPVEICFGQQIPADLRSHVRRRKVLVVTSPGFTNRGLTAQIAGDLESGGLQVRVVDTLSPNPTFTEIERTMPDLYEFAPEEIVAIGGGSVIDSAKVFSYLLQESAPRFETVVSDLRAGKSLPVHEPIPLICIPTTAGTGSEVTPFATLWDDENKKKYSVANAKLFPAKALICPELTVSLPWDVTLLTGLDALSQCIESVWNKNYSPLAGIFAARAVRLIFAALPRLASDPSDLQARAQMLEASLLSGLCISQTRTALAHSISYPLTAHYGTPHGIACSFTLPVLWQFNMHDDDGRMATLASESLGVSVDNFSDELLRLMTGLGFGAHLAKTVTGVEHTLKLLPEMYTKGRSDNNLREVSPDQLKDIVSRSLEVWSLGKT